MTTATAEPTTTLSKFNVTSQALAKIKAETMSLSVRDNGIAAVETAHKNLKKLYASIEKRRIELKAGPLRLCNEIDSAAKELSEELAPALEHLKTERKIHDDAAEEKKRLAREAERKKVQDRIDRLTAVKLPVDLLAVQTLSDAAFDASVIEGMQARAEQERLQAEAKAAEEKQRTEAARIAAAELIRQQEELRIRAEELAADRAKMQRQIDEERAAIAAQQEIENAERKRLQEIKAAADAEERRKIDAEKAALALEQERIRAEEAKRQAEIAALAKIERDRIKAEEEADNLREWQAQQARDKEAAEAAAAALRPEIEKAEAFANFIDNQAAVWLNKAGNPEWSKQALGFLEVAYENISEYIKGR